MKPTTLEQIIKQKEDLQKQIAQLEIETEKMLREKSKDIIKSALVRLEEISQEIQPLIEKDLINWNDGSWDGILERLNLQSNKPKPKAIDEDFKKQIVDFLKKQPTPLTIDEIATKFVDAGGQQMYKKPTINVKLQPIAAAGIVKKIPGKSRAFVYSV